MIPAPTHDRSMVPYLRLGIGFVVGAVLALVGQMSPWSVRQPVSQTTVFDAAPDDLIDWTVLDPSLSPESVVRRQLVSMQETRDNPMRLVECYSLASPANRRQTGPFSRFAQLFDSSNFRWLIGHRGAMVGRASMQGPEASVVVTLIGEDNQTHAFCFILTRQRGEEPDRGTPGAEAAWNAGSPPPFRDCWMTDAVLPIRYEPTPSVGDENAGNANL